MLWGRFHPCLVFIFEYLIMGLLFSDSCDRILTNTSGTLSSLGYPNTFPIPLKYRESNGNTTCIDSIIVTEGKFIKLEFEEFDVSP